MTAHLAGSIWIDKADFYTDLRAALETNNVKTSGMVFWEDAFKFTGEREIHGTLYPERFANLINKANIPYRCRQSFELDDAWFWRLAMQYTPGADAHQCAFGRPRFETNGVVIDVVINTENPRSTREWTNNLEPQWRASPGRLTLADLAPPKNPPRPTSPTTKAPHA